MLEHNKISEMHIYKCVKWFEEFGENKEGNGC